MSKQENGSSNQRAYPQSHPLRETPGIIRKKGKEFAYHNACVRSGVRWCASEALLRSNVLRVLETGVGDATGGSGEERARGWVLVVSAMSVIVSKSEKEKREDQTHCLLIWRCLKPASFWLAGDRMASDGEMYVPDCLLLEG